MRLIVVAACTLLVGLVVGAAGATTGGARAQETPIRYEYRVWVPADDPALANRVQTYFDYSWDTEIGMLNSGLVLDGWELVQTQTQTIDSNCRGGPWENGGNWNSISRCEYGNKHIYLLRRPRQ